MNQSPSPAAAPPQGSPWEQSLTSAAPALRRYLYGLCGRWDRADDLTQEALLRAWRARDGFAGRSGMNTWLFAIAANVWRDDLRRKKARPTMQAIPLEYDIADGERGPALSARRSEFAQALARAMDALPPEQREALAMRESGGLTFAEIAEVLGIPAATVKSRVRYALLKLAEQLHPFRQELEP